MTRVLGVEHFPQRAAWGNPVELEVKRRIGLSVGAYAYEIADTPIMPDTLYDHLAQQIRPKLGTCHPILDEFFATCFSPMTGMWIHEHPELDGIRRIYTRYYTVMRDYFEQPGIQRLVRRQGP